MRGEHLTRDGAYERERGRLRPPVLQPDQGLPPHPVAHVEAWRRNGIDRAVNHDVEAELAGLLQHRALLRRRANERLGLQQVAGNLQDLAS